MFEHIVKQVIITLLQQVLVTKTNFCEIRLFENVGKYLTKVFLCIQNEVYRIIFSLFSLEVHV